VTSINLTDPGYRLWFIRMPRISRAAVGGMVYHVLNRGNGRIEVFREPGDYQAFADLLVEEKRKADVEIFALPEKLADPIDSASG
jgi:hypothetical protein